MPKLKSREIREQVPLQVPLMVGKAMIRLSGVVSGILFLLAASGCSSDPGGCEKDTDCASGRICGSDGRCVAADAPGQSGVGDARAGSTSSQPVGTDCDAYLGSTKACGDACRCGTHVTTLSTGDCFCDYSCVTDI